MKPGYRGPAGFPHIDTILYGRKLRLARSVLAEHDGWIDVFARPTTPTATCWWTNGAPAGDRKKIVISNLAAFRPLRFASAATYRDHYDPEQDEYVTPVYKRMITRGRSVDRPSHSESDTVVLGTPTEYLNVNHRSRRLFSNEPMHVEVVRQSFLRTRRPPSRRGP